MRSDCKYDADKAAKIIELMAAGYTVTAAAGKLRVHRDTVYGWAETIPEFKEAFDIARQARQAYWEDEIISTKQAARVTASIFALKNANPKEWADKKQVEASGPDGGPIETKSTIDVTTLTDEQLAALLEIVKSQA